MLRYEFVRCMELRKKLVEKIKGQIFVGSKNGEDVTISILGCPTCRYQVDLNNIRSNSASYISSYNVDELANVIYEDYKKFIQRKFFI